MVQVDSRIRENRSLFTAAIIQVIYGLIELIDSIAIVLISIGIIPNLYVSLITADTIVGGLLETMPVLFIPIFFFFTGFRLLSAYWILQNKVKGFWLALFITVVTLFATWFLLPFSVIDMIVIFPFILLLLMGYFEDESIIS